MSKSLYVGINGVARKVRKIYVGVNGVARKVKVGYIGIANAARKFFEAIRLYKPIYAGVIQMTFAKYGGMNRSNSAWLPSYLYLGQVHYEDNFGRDHSDCLFMNSSEVGTSVECPSGEYYDRIIGNTSNRMFISGGSGNSTDSFLTSYDNNLTSTCEKITDLIGRGGLFAGLYGGSASFPDRHFIFDNGYLACAYDNATMTSFGRPITYNGESISGKLDVNWGGVIGNNFVVFTSTQRRGGYDKYPTLAVEAFNKNGVKLSTLPNANVIVTNNELHPNGNQLVFLTYTERSAIYASVIYDNLTMNQNVVGLTANLYHDSNGPRQEVSNFMTCFGTVIGTTAHIEAVGSNLTHYYQTFALQNHDSGVSFDFSVLGNFNNNLYGSYVGGVNAGYYTKAQKFGFIEM